MLDYFYSQFKKYEREPAIVWNNQTSTYSDLLKNIEKWKNRLLELKIKDQETVTIIGDFSPTSIALLIALIEKKCIIVPLTRGNTKTEQFNEVAQVKVVIKLKKDDEFEVHHLEHKIDHPILLELIKNEQPGLVVFSSGTTGNNKAAVHNFLPLLNKFKVPRKAKRMITFLLFDHLGGINTLFYILSNGGCIVTVSERTPEVVAKAIEQHKVQILPTSPTFINLILLSEVYKKYDLSSLESVTYGTEPMPESTLKKFHEIFPHLELQQTYGLSELGVLRTKSKSSASLWVKIGGEDFETRVVDNLLEIKSKSMMLGYLNAESPITSDGWFQTGDLVEVEGEYFRILGRKSDLINVGGEKVYPSEIENVLQTMEGVMEVTVSGEPNALLGTIVKATVRLSSDETAEAFKKRMMEFCKDKLARFKIPQRVILRQDELHTDRFKKIRRL